MQPQGPSFPSALAQLQTPAFTDKSKKTLLISDMNPCSVWRVHLDVPQTSQPTGLSQCPHFPQIPRLLWSPLPRKWQPLSSTLISDPPFLRCPCSVYQQIPCSRLSSAAPPSAPPPQHTRVVLSTVQRGPRTSGSATRQKRKGKERCKDCEETNQNVSQITCNY